ncbi:flavoprotein, partial [Suillus plorans]
YQNVEVKVVATKESLAFYDRTDVVKTGGRVICEYTKFQDEFLHINGSHKKGEPTLHIELMRSADIVLVTPCPENTLSKIAHGLCDNLSTSLLRALAPTTPTYISTAMNTLIYEHPLTAEHVRIVRDVVRYQIVGPLQRISSCGDVGLGAMTEW